LTNQRSPVQILITSGRRSSHQIVTFSVMFMKTDIVHPSSSGIGLRARPDVCAPPSNTANPAVTAALLAARPESAL
jgi:hypothetical protein